jgi:hypothetical protein
LQNINESELYFGQLDQNTEQTICNIYANIIMKQTNPFCTEAVSETDVGVPAHVLVDAAQAGTYGSCVWWVTFFGALQL